MYIVFEIPIFFFQLDKNESIELDEFLTLYRYLEAKKFDEEKCTQLFMQFADILTDESKSFFCFFSLQFPFLTQRKSDAVGSI